MRYLFDLIGIARPRYFDIGAHHPWYLNNTWLFYRQGSHGVNIEPDPALHARLQRTRGRDVTLNVGIGPTAGEMEFFVMSNRTLNTFSAIEAHKYVERHGERIIETRTIRLETFDRVVETAFDRTPDLVSLDVEGLDLAVLRSIDFSRHRPHVFCVETLSYAAGDDRGVKNEEIHALMLANDYRLYADTYINSIYISTAVWEACGKQH